MLPHETTCTDTEAEAGLTLQDALRKIRELEASLAERISAEVAMRQIEALLEDMKTESAGCGGGRAQPQRVRSALVKGEGSLLLSVPDDAGGWAASPIATPRFGGGVDLIQRVTQLERENALIDARRVESEQEAAKQKQNFIDLHAHMSSGEHMIFLSSKLAHPYVPPAFAGVPPEELLGKLVEAFEEQSAKCLVLRSRVTALESQLSATEKDYRRLDEEARLREEVAASHDSVSETLCARIDALTANQERLIRENSVMHSAVTTQTRHLERVAHLLKEREKERLESLAEGDALRTALAEAQREAEDRKEKIRSLETERDISARLLEAERRKVAESERRWADLAQLSVLEGSDESYARKMQSRWIDIVRALGAGRPPVRSSHGVVAPTQTPLTRSASGIWGGWSAAAHRAAPTAASPSQSPQPVHVAHGVPPSPNVTLQEQLPVLSSHQVSPVPLAVSRHPSSVFMAAPVESLPAALRQNTGAPSASEQQQQHEGPVAISHASSKVSSLDCDEPSKVNNKNNAHPRAALAAGRSVKGAGPGRPPLPPAATLAALSRRVKPNVRLRDNSVLEKALMTRAERTRLEAATLAAAAQSKRRLVPPPPPKLLSDIMISK